VCNFVFCRRVFDGVSWSMPLHSLMFHGVVSCHNFIVSKQHRSASCIRSSSSPSDCRHSCRKRRRGRRHTLRRKRILLQKNVKTAPQIVAEHTMQHNATHTR